MTERKRYLWLVLSLVAGLSIIGCGGGSNSSTPPPVPADFSMAVSPASVTVTQGSSSSPMAISISPLHSFSGTVSVSFSGLPAGISTSPAMPLAIAAGSTQSVTFSAANAATLGPVNLTITGTSGALSHTAGATMAVNAAADFGINIEPGQLSVTQGSSSTPATISITPLNSFSGTVSVNVKGLPAGVVASQALPLQIGAGSKQQITFTAANTAAAGTMSLSFQGTSGNLSHSANAALQIQSFSLPDFRLSADNSSVTLQPGGASQKVNLTVSSLNEFASSVSVAVSGLPKGVTASPSSLVIGAGETKPLTFIAAKGTGAGKTNVSLTGTNGALSHSVPGSIQVFASTGTTPTFSVAYFDSTLLPTGSPVLDQSIRIVNPGAQSTSSALGDLCANIYVFDSSQELKECCSCEVTANGFLRLSITGNLTNNPGNGVAFAAGSVDVVPSVLSSSTTCDPTSVSPVPTLNVWSTHVANKGAGFGLVETAAPSAPLSSGELSELQNVCGFIISNQSGAGICSCAAE